MSMASAKRIFVIDDESTHRILAKDYLEEAGYVVRLAEDGARALKMAKSVRPDLVLIDLMIPSMDGFELCNALKSTEGMADVPVILVTASREPDVILRGLKAGIDDFITKPIDWAFLADRVALVLGLAEQKRKINAEKRELEEQLKVSQTHDRLAAIADEPALPTQAMESDSSGSNWDVETALQAARQSAAAELQELESRYLAMLEAQSASAETASQLHARELAQARAEHEAALADVDRTAREQFAEERNAFAEQLSALQLENETALESALENARIDYDSRVQQLEDMLAAVRTEVEQGRERHAMELADARSAAEAQLSMQKEDASRETHAMASSHAAQLSELERKLDDALTFSSSTQEHIQAEMEARYEAKLRSCWSITQLVTATQLQALKHLSENVRSILNDKASGPSAGAHGATPLHIERTFGSISTALGNLRMLAHMMSGNAVLDESSCDISAIVEEVILKLKSFAAMNRISLTCSLPDQPVRIRADGPRVTYSLVNLTINAIRHSPVGSEVTISVGGGAGRATVIEVRDHGVGIAPSKLVALQNCLDVPSGLFDTDKSGFGIPLAAAIARLHGGGLELESRPGAGTTAVLRFPESRSLDQGDQSAPLKLAGFAAR